MVWFEMRQRRCTTCTQHNTYRKLPPLVLGFVSQGKACQEHESHTKLENSTNTPEVVLGLENVGQKRLWLHFYKLDEDVTNDAVEVIHVVKQLECSFGRWNSWVLCA